MSARSQALVPLRATGRMAGGGGDENAAIRETRWRISVCGGVFPLSERKPQDIAV